MDLVDGDLRGDTFWERVREVIAGIPRDVSTPPEGARVGAVLALVEDTEQGPGLVLTRRRQDLRSHPGQLSFPGGRVDAGETIEQAALREAWEEIGLRRESVEVAGTGPTFYIPPSRFWVVPVVARWRDPHELEANPWEVDEVLRVPVASLLERDRWRYVPLSDGDAMWAWRFGDDLLWGATAMMIHALLDVVLEGWSGGLDARDLGLEREERPWEEFPARQPPAVLADVPEIPVGGIPVVTARQAREVTRLLRERSNVESPVLLEHGARAIADATRRLLGGDLTGRDVTVLVGPGGTGTAGLAAARLLEAGGARVTVALVGRPRAPDQVEALRSAGVGVIAVAARPDTDLAAGDAVVDALLGAGARPPVHGEVAEAIEWLHRNFAPVVAVDLPSGVHPDDGLRGICVSADVTVALGAPKPALLERLTRPYVGDLYVADLGIPASVWERAGVEPVTVFGRGPLVRVLIDDGAG